MDAKYNPALTQQTAAKKAVRLVTSFGWPTGFTRIGLALAVYGATTALLLQRAPAILGDDWSWVAILVVPALTLLVAGLQTGTALALVLVYAFATATAMAVQGYRLSWSATAQAEYIFSHFSTVFFLASVVALVSVLRSRQLALQHARELVRLYVQDDEVTGLLTRTAFEAAVSREINRSRRTSRPFLLLSIDVSDYFKPGLGSATLGVAEKMLGKVLCAETRDNYDLWTAWGNNLYVGLLIETDERAVRPALERVLRRMAKAPEFAGAELVDKARFGFACYPDDGDTLETLMDAAVTDVRPVGELLSPIPQTTGALR